MSSMVVAYNVAYHASLIVLWEPSTHAKPMMYTCLAHTSFKTIGEPVEYDDIYLHSSIIIPVCDFLPQAQALLEKSDSFVEVEDFELHVSDSECSLACEEQMPAQSDDFIQIPEHMELSEETKVIHRDRREKYKSYFTSSWRLCDCGVPYLSPGEASIIRAYCLCVPANKHLIETLMFRTSQEELREKSMQENISNFLDKSRSLNMVSCFSSFTGAATRSDKPGKRPGLKLSGDQIKTRVHCFNKDANHNPIRVFGVRGENDTEPDFTTLSKDEIRQSRNHIRSTALGKQLAMVDVETETVRIVKASAAGGSLLQIESLGTTHWATMRYNQVEEQEKELTDIVLQPNGRPQDSCVYLAWSDSRLEALSYPWVTYAYGWPHAAPHLTIRKYYKHLLYGAVRLQLLGSVQEQYLCHALVRIEASNLAGLLSARSQAQSLRQMHGSKDFYRERLHSLLHKVACARRDPATVHDAAINNLPFHASRPKPWFPNLFVTRTSNRKDPLLEAGMRAFGAKRPCTRDRHLINKDPDLVIRCPMIQARVFRQQQCELQRLFVEEFGTELGVTAKEDQGRRDPHEHGVHYIPALDPELHSAESRAQYATDHFVDCRRRSWFEVPEEIRKAHYHVHGNREGAKCWKKVPRGSLICGDHFPAAVCEIPQFDEAGYFLAARDDPMLVETHADLAAAIGSHVCIRVVSRHLEILIYLLGYVLKEEGKLPVATEVKVKEVEEPNVRLNPDMGEKLELEQRKRTLCEKFRRFESRRVLSASRAVWEILGYPLVDNLQTNTISLESAMDVWLRRPLLLTRVTWSAYIESYRETPQKIKDISNKRYQVALYVGTSTCEKYHVYLRNRASITRLETIFPRKEVTRKAMIWHILQHWAGVDDTVSLPNNFSSFCLGLESLEACYRFLRQNLVVGMSVSLDYVVRLGFSPSQARSYFVHELCTEDPFDARDIYFKYRGYLADSDVEKDSSILAKLALVSASLPISDFVTTYHLSLICNPDRLGEGEVTQLDEAEAATLLKKKTLTVEQDLALQQIVQRTMNFLQGTTAADVQERPGVTIDEAQTSSRVLMIPVIAFVSTGKSYLTDAAYLHFRAYGTCSADIRFDPVNRGATHTACHQQRGSRTIHKGFSLPVLRHARDKNTRPSIKSLKTSANVYLFGEAVFLHATYHEMIVAKLEGTPGRKVLIVDGCFLQRIPIPLRAEQPSSVLCVTQGTCVPVPSWKNITIASLYHSRPANMIFLHENRRLREVSVTHLPRIHPGELKEKYRRWTIDVGMGVLNDADNMVFLDPDWHRIHTIPKTHNPHSRTLLFHTVFNNSPVLQGVVRIVYSGRCVKKKLILHEKIRLSAQLTHRCIVCLPHIRYRNAFNHWFLTLMDRAHGRLLVQKSKTRIHAISSLGPTLIEEQVHKALDPVLSPAEESGVLRGSLALLPEAWYRMFCTLNDDLSKGDIVFLASTKPVLVAKRSDILATKQPWVPLYPVPRVSQIFEKTLSRESDITLQMKRVQLPLLEWPAASIDISQGRGAEEVHCILFKSMFSHGQLHVVATRTEIPSGVQYYADEDMLVEHANKKGLRISNPLDHGLIQELYKAYAKSSQIEFQSPAFFESVV